MDPERKIETWLRAYAKKRRGQAGDSFKLDPATRRILQNEISGSTPVPEDVEEGMSLWKVLRRNWVFYLGFAVCIFILASFFFKTFKAAKTKDLASMSTQSMPKDDREIRGSLQPPLANGGGAITNNQAVMLSDNVGSLQRVPGSARPGPITNQNAPQIAAAGAGLSTEDSTSPGSPAPVFSQNGAGRITNETFAALAPSKELPAEVVNNASAPAPATEALVPETSALPAQSQDMPPAAAAPPVPASGLYAAALTPVNGLLQGPEAGEERKFGAAPISGPTAQYSFMNMMSPTLQAGTVLMNFRVVQIGNNIRVVDRDGSVYEGTLSADAWEALAAAQTETASANATTARVESPRMVESDQLASTRQPVTEERRWHFHWPSLSFGGHAPPATAAEPPAGLAIPVNAGALPSTQVYSFRVGGMNRTLNQPVMFTATLIEDLAAMKLGQTNQAGQLPWSSLRITGTAVINRTNQLQINAAPMTPAGRRIN